MSDSIVNLNKYRSKKKRSTIKNDQEESDLNIKKLKEEFNDFLNLEKKGGGDVGRNRKDDS